MPSTSNYEFPYPASSDPPDGAGQIRDLAESVDEEIARVEATEDTSSGATAESGWSINRFNGKIWGKVCSVVLDIERTGDTIEATDHEGNNPGNISDEHMATLPSGYRPEWLINTLGGTGRVSGECTINTSGEIRLRDFTPGGSIEETHLVRVTATYIVP